MLLSIQGMYEYDNSIFDGFRVPEGLDKNDCINNIVIKCAELEILYTDFAILKHAIATWSNSNQIPWKKMYNTMTVEYNPIWNVDADIVTNTKGTNSRNSSTSGTENRDITRENNGQQTNTDSYTDINTPSINDIKSVKGFNSDIWSEAEKNERRGTDTTTHTGESETDIVNIETINDDLTKGENLIESGKNDISYTERRTGNIGVTATQDLIKKEREIAAFNMIDYITESFKLNFCLMVY